jgi:hypothetical protein
MASVHILRGGGGTLRATPLLSGGVLPCLLYHDDMGFNLVFIHAPGVSLSLVMQQWEELRVELERVSGLGDRLPPDLLPELRTYEILYARHVLLRELEDAILGGPVLGDVGEVDTAAIDLGSLYAALSHIAGAGRAGGWIAWLAEQGGLVYRMREAWSRRDFAALGLVVEEATARVESGEVQWFSDVMDKEVVTARYELLDRGRQAEIRECITRDLDAGALMPLAPEKLLRLRSQIDYARQAPKYSSKVMKRLILTMDFLNQLRAWLEARRWADLCMMFDDKEVQYEDCLDGLLMEAVEEEDGGAVIVLDTTCRPLVEAARATAIFKNVERQLSEAAREGAITGTFGRLDNRSAYPGTLREAILYCRECLHPTAEAEVGSLDV